MGAFTDHQFEITEKTEFLESILRQIEPKMQATIRLKWLEGFSDKEVVAQKMSHFTTVNSLKNRRKEAMQQLAVISQHFRS